MPRIFVSYRRSDSAYAASRIRDSIEDEFGPGTAVYDIDTIPLGADFLSYVTSQIEKCDVLLAVIGDRWLETLNERKNDDRDFVRLEISAALDRAIPVVPVLVDRASVPGERQLPKDIASLALRNAAEVRSGRDEKNHLRRLNSQIRKLIPQTAAEKRGSSRRLTLSTARPALVTISLLGMASILAFGLWQMVEPTMTEKDAPVTAAEAEQSIQGQQSNIESSENEALRDITSMSLANLTMASDNGDTNAQYELATRYEAGAGGAVRDIGRALRLYRTAAVNDHPRACYRLGLLYFDGSLITKDLVQAEQWFRKAAEMSDRDAATMMGHFYETGVVVEKDLSIASEWYSVSMGISSDAFIVDPNSNDKLRIALPTENELKRLTTLARYRSRAALYTDGLAPVFDSGDAANSLFAKALADSLRSARRIFTGSELALQVRAAHTSDPVADVNVSWAKNNAFGAGDFVFLPQSDYLDGVAREVQQALDDFGKYYALIIANQEYKNMARLNSPVSDARLVGSILEERYGFSVEYLYNATDDDVMARLFGLRSVLLDNDNLIVYYAGRGFVSEKSNVRYWLGVNAEPEKPWTWLLTEHVNESLRLVEAKNILVLSNVPFFEGPTQ